MLASCSTCRARRRARRAWRQRGAGATAMRLRTRAASTSGLALALFWSQSYANGGLHEHGTGLSPTLAGKGVRVGGQEPLTDFSSREPREQPWGVCWPENYSSYGGCAELGSPSVEPPADVNVTAQERERTLQRRALVWCFVWPVSSTTGTRCLHLV